MESDHASLAAVIHKIFPTSKFTPVLEPELDAIRARYPGVPEHYLAFLRQVGFGSLGDNFMVYGGLVEPDEIFDAGTAAGLTGLLVLGDNFAGEVFGFDTKNEWRLVGVDIAYSPDLMPEDTQTIAAFIAKRLADQERD